MAITIKDFNGFETQTLGAEEVDSESATLEITPAPWSSKEVAVMKLTNVDPGVPGGDDTGFVRGKSVTHGTNWLTIGCILRWSDFGVSTSVGEFLWGRGSVPPFKLAWVRNGNLAAVRLIDANGATVATSGDVLRENEWFSIQIKLNISGTGEALVKVNGVTVIHETGVDLDSAQTTVEVYIRNGASAVDAVNLFVDSYYCLTDDGANIDTNNTMLNWWTVIRHPISGITTNDPALDSFCFGDILDLHDGSEGTWDDAERAPLDETDYCRYSTTGLTIDKGGGVTCARAATGGPRDNPYYSGIIKAVKFLWRYKTTASTKAVPTPPKFFGKYGRQVIGSEGTDNTTATASQANSSTFKWLEVLSNATPGADPVPKNDEYFQIGFGADDQGGGFGGSGDVDCAEMYALTLQKESRKRGIEGRHTEIVNPIL